MPAGQMAFGDVKPSPTARAKVKKVFTDEMGAVVPGDAALVDLVKNVRRGLGDLGEPRNREEAFEALRGGLLPLGAALLERCPGLGDVDADKFGAVLYDL